MPAGLNLEHGRWSLYLYMSVILYSNFGQTIANFTLKLCYSLVYFRNMDSRGTFKHGIFWTKLSINLIFACFYNWRWLKQIAYKTFASVFSFNTAESWVLQNFGLEMDGKWPGSGQTEFELLGKREENISKKIFPFLLVVYETLLVCQVSEKLIFRSKGDWHLKVVFSW